MATYGGPGKNFFKLPGANSNNNYYVIVNADNGVTEVYRQGGTLQGDISIGTYNPTTSKFTENKTNITSIEAGAIINPNNAALNQIKNSAIQTAVNGGLSQAEAQKLITPNTAPAAPQQPGQGGTPPPAPTLPPPGQTGTGQIGETQQLDIAGGRGSSGLRYPKKMKPEQDKIKFQACRISPRAASPGTGLKYEFGKPQYEPTDGPVCLAIQAPISDQNSVDWGPDSVNAIESALYEKSLDFMNTGTGELGQKANTFAGQIMADFKKYSEVTKKYLAGQAAGINNVLARTDNIILNPNLELLFQGPQLRPFTFQFKMSARSQEEADEIKAIVKYFKYHMAVRKTDDNLFLKAPHVFTIRYLKGDLQNHPGINVISPNESQKACALTNCSVDYTPLGSYMTYEDGTMVAYTLSLQFQELTPIYDTDYKNYPNDIGF